jgi:hypothetical protein
MTRSFFRTRVALVVVSSLVGLDALAWGNGCSSDDGQGGSTPLLDCADGGCASPSTASAGSGGGGGTGIGTGAGTGSGDGTGTGGGTGDDGGGTGTGTGSSIAEGGSGNILPTDTGSTGSLPTNTE